MVSEVISRAVLLLGGDSGDDIGICVPPVTGEELGLRSSFMRPEALPVERNGGHSR